MRMLWQKSRFYDIIILQLNRDRERIAKDRPVLFYFSFLPQICPTNPRDAYKTMEYFYYNKLTTTKGRMNPNCPKVSVLCGFSAVFVRFRPCQKLPHGCHFCRFLPHICPTDPERKRRPRCLEYSKQRNRPQGVSLRPGVTAGEKALLWARVSCC